MGKAPRYTTAGTGTSDNIDDSSTSFFWGANENADGGTPITPKTGRVIRDASY